MDFIFLFCVTIKPIKHVPITMYPIIMFLVWERNKENKCCMFNCGTIFDSPRSPTTLMVEPHCVATSCHFVETSWRPSFKTTQEFWSVGGSIPGGFRRTQKNNKRMKATLMI